MAAQPSSRNDSSSFERLTESVEQGSQPIFDTMALYRDERFQASNRTDALATGLPSDRELLSQLNQSSEARLAFNPLDMVRDVINNQGSRALRVEPEQARQVLENHNLQGTFNANVLKQLEENGRVRIGIIDNFSPGETHGRNVEERLVASLPDYLRNRVDIVRYDVSQGRHQAFQNAIQDARDKDIVALSVSGGLETVNLDGLEQSIGAKEINSTNRAQSIETALQRFGNRSDYQEIRQDMVGISSVSTVIPVVTPIWNDGNTTPAALGRNVIVTSISGDGTRATQSPLVDIAIAPLPGNQFSSQSAPRVVGGLLSTVSEAQVNEALHR
ncbi:MAG: hypothetical protein SFV17_19610 [Candidatus Obscuribacter sp.]|nr:hypothetical protein [Candidatus Obscuribacter sp.]